MSDHQRDQKLNKHLEADDGELSNCCSERIFEDTDICSHCGDHCVTLAYELLRLKDSETDDRIETERESRDENI